MSKTIPCQFCETCSRPACSERVKPSPSPSPIVPVVTPIIPKPVPVPVPNPVKNTIPLESLLTQELWDKSFPYADLSSVYCPIDKKPMYRFEDLIEAVKFMNKHEDSRFHGFCDNKNDRLNKLELAAFLGNFAHETSDASLESPMKWIFPPADPVSGPEKGVAGGGLCIIEGLLPMIASHKRGTKSPYDGPLKVTMGFEDFRPAARKTLGIHSDDVVSCVIQSVAGAYQPGFGLGTGSPAIQEHYCAVADDGTLWGEFPKPTNEVIKLKKDYVQSLSNRSTTSMGTYSIYSGRNATMLSYNFNMTDFSLDIFKDYRVVRYPNLLTTVDRKTWNNIPECFGFPGPNPGGKNLLPVNIDTTTPDARIVGWLSALHFWMIPRSGRPISCHECMLQPDTYGAMLDICIIVNNQDGVNPPNSWASYKLKYYKRILDIMGEPVGRTLTPPSRLKVK